MWCFSKVIKCFKNFKAKKREKEFPAIHPRKPGAVFNKKAEKSDTIQKSVLPLK